MNRTDVTEMQSQLNLQIEDDAWIKDGQSKIYSAIRGDQAASEIGHALLNTVASIFPISVAAIYLVDDFNDLKLIAGYSLPDNARKTIKARQGALGECVSQKKTRRITDIPDESLNLETSLISLKPQELILIPFIYEDSATAICELATPSTFKDKELKLLETISEYVAIAFRSALKRESLELLLEKTKAQSEELKAQQEEIKFQNQELESQAQSLEQAQDELKRVNCHLAEQRDAIASEKIAVDRKNQDLRRSQRQLVEKAQQLESATKYKSEFLANMSHELRTPLNSMLILSKLLRENTEGNLSEEQVSHVNTIASAGSDLLDLVNDVLDLAKVESGQVKLKKTEVVVKNFISGIKNSLEALARDKGLDLTAKCNTNDTQTIHTDEVKFRQILKNLVANAIKFTLEGKVSIEVMSQNEQLVVDVIDTGIGISDRDQKLIFEAFHQVDGSTSRSFTGTGLGLSISRELAHILGGEIKLESRIGIGSKFSLTLPLSTKTDTNLTTANPQPFNQTSTPTQPLHKTSQNLKEIKDDREQIDHASQSVLIIEDDVHYSGILSKIAKDRGYLTIRSFDGDDGCELAKTYQPSAIILDINLPKIDGYGVLGRLKHDPQTRHIPVQILTVKDYDIQPLQMGAFGYVRKTEHPEELQQLFDQLSARIDSRHKKVLIIEDDKIQVDQIAKIIQSDNVGTTFVNTGTKALESLTADDFDCVILDIHLPDMTGFDLLELLTKQLDKPLPPIIIYTGKDLTADEELKLRLYSQSIILKGARSPERLLDETTLFLHQLESRLGREQRNMLERLRDTDLHLANKTVLIVDDDMRNLYATSSLLRQKRINCIAAKNGKEALEKLETHAEIKLILMDIMMPTMDGYEAIALIRRNPKWSSLPIIALTAKALKEDKEKCLQVGANEYLSKPIDIDRLFSLLRIWLERY